jgi:hypothetical protein
MIVDSDSVLFLIRNPFGIDQFCPLIISQPVSSYMPVDGSCESPHLRGYLTEGIEVFL